MFEHVKIPIDAVWAAGSSVVVAGASALGILWAANGDQDTKIIKLETKVERAEEDLAYIRSRTDDIYQILLEDRKEKPNE